MSVKYAYGYIRVSTHDQEEISPDSQEHLLRDYASKNNIVILKIFTDLGISGRKANKRPGFQEMIGLAKGDDHPVDQILVWKFSRFARNQEESIVYKSLLKKQHNVDVVSVSEPLSDNPFGSLIERIIEWMDEYYSIRLSGEVYRGMKENALRGAYQARPPLGYKVVEHGKPPVIVPEEAKIVRTIFEKYTNEGMSFFDIARYLNSLGLKTSHGKPFERRSVEYIIQNPSYCGMIRWNRTENSTNRIKDKDEWIDLFAITYKVDFYLFIMLFYVYFTTISCSNPARWNLHPDIVSDHLTSPVRFSMYSVQQCHQLYVHTLSAMFSPHSLFQRQRFHLLCHS